MEYTVTLSQVLQQQVRQLQLAAGAVGAEELFMSAFRTISERLGTDPLQFGEVLYHLPSSQAPVQVGIVIPLAVVFSVQEPLRQVWFVRICVLFGHGFE
jgi:hypothetical protein